MIALLKFMQGGGGYRGTGWAQCGRMFAMVRNPGFKIEKIGKTPVKKPGFKSVLSGLMANGLWLDEDESGVHRLVRNFPPFIVRPASYQFF
ncbi:MAG: hypothetical protein CM15mP46_6240 [Alphaproteobacteria bacterium]|nr:MAG: hypothetical protein CM15mP46_6240 [Alphaproteobacteria bacterium]